MRILFRAIFAFVLMDFGGVAKAADDCENLPPFRELQCLKNKFSDATQIWPGCLLDDTTQCIRGVKMLLGIVDTGVFATDRFDTIYISTDFSPVDTLGSLHVPFDGEPTQVHDFLAATPDTFARLLALETEFEANTLHNIGCFLDDDLEACIDATKKLLSIVDVITVIDHFDTVYITDQFENVDSLGSVYIDAFASAEDIKAFLLAQ